jgi:hypothetical protein
MKVNELIPKNGESQGLYCKHCSKPIRLIFKTFDEEVDGTRIVIENLPILYCKDCESQHLTEPSRMALVKLHFDAWRTGKKRVHSKRQKNEEGFGFTEVPFRYDADDYYYLPGLTRPNSVGFLTPVFFEKQVLIRFENSSQYVVSFASRTYGQIYKNVEYGICFGVNQNDKVVMWLGDIATLPLNEQYALLADNIESDHCIGSEFYDSQIEGVFTDPSPEENLIKARSTFHRRAFDYFGKRLSHLSEESLQLIKDLKRPISFTEREVKHVIDILHKLNSETLNSANIGSLIEDRGSTVQKMGSLRKLEELLQLEFPEKQTSQMLAPFFALNKLRVTYLHMHSKGTRRNQIASVKRTLALPEETSTEDLYEALLENLTDSYLRLSEIM